MNLQTYILELLGVVVVFALYSTLFIPLYILLPEFWYIYIGATILFICINVIVTAVKTVVDHIVFTKKNTNQELQSYVNSKVESVAESMNIKTPKISIVPNPIMNASVTGLTHTTSHIEITSELLRKLTSEEINAVIAHELSHIKSRDVPILYVIQTPYSIFKWVSNGCRRAFASKNQNFAVLLLVPVKLITDIYLRVLLISITLLMRQREYTADIDASREVSPIIMIRTLEKIHAHNGQFRSDETGTLFSDFSNRIHSTHPPLEKRRENIKKHFDT